MNLRAIMAFVEKNFKTTIREKSELLWIIVFPIFMLALTAYIFIPPGEHVVKINVGVVDYDNPPPTLNFTSRTLIQIFEDITVSGEKVFTIINYRNKTKALKDLREGRIDAALVFPEGFASNLTYGSAKMKVYIAYGDPSERQVTDSMIRSIISGISKNMSMAKIDVAMNYITMYVQDAGTREYIRMFLNGIAEPINASFKEVKPETVYSRPLVLGWTTLAMIGVMMLFTGIIGGATSIVREKERGTLRKILAAPLSPWDVLIGNTLEILLELLISGIITVLFGVIVIGAQIYWRWDIDHILVIPLLALGGLSMIGLGLILSMLCKSTRGATGLGNAIAWPLMFLTGIWIPKWFLPGPLRIFAEYFPLTQLLDVVRGIVVYQRPIVEFSAPIMAGVTMALIIYVAGSIIWRNSIEKLIT